MTTEQALQYLAQLGIERANDFKDSPATQGAILSMMKIAHDTLRAAIGGTDGNPAD